MQRWRATAARAAGTPVSLRVAPATRTRSVVKNRLLAAAFSGAHRFGIEVFEPATSNTLGTKGVGEAGTIASTPAVVNAVVDAVRHLGVNDIRMPCTPQRVWEAIRTAGSGGSTEGAAMPHFDPDEPGTSSTEGAGA